MTDASSIKRLGLFLAQTAGEAARFCNLIGKALGDFVLGPVDGVMLQQTRGVVACA